MKTRTLATAMAAICMIGCSKPPPVACAPNTKVLAAIASSTDGGTTRRVVEQGELLGWQLSNVGANASIRKHGFADGDLLARVCGLSVDDFVNAPGDICCEGLVLSFRRADASYDITLEHGAQPGVP